MFVFLCSKHQLKQNQRQLGVGFFYSCYFLLLVSLTPDLLNGSLLACVGLSPHGSPPLTSSQSGREVGLGPGGECSLIDQDPTKCCHIWALEAEVKPIADSHFPVALPHMTAEPLVKAFPPATSACRLRTRSYQLGSKRSPR